MAKLGVNIDHIATVRQARRAGFPSIEWAVRESLAGGADGITAHLREDRRHIQDADIPAIQRVCRVPFNLEMALHPDIVKIALSRRPEKVCIVPEKRRELTTEGGLDVASARKKLSQVIPQFRKNKIQVSLFIDPDPAAIALSSALGAAAIEIHTGTYAEVRGAQRKKELERIREAAELAHALGLKVHAGHGLDYENTSGIARIPEIEELNIGFSIVSRALAVGLRQAVREMKRLCRG